MGMIFLHESSPDENASELYVARKIIDSISRFMIIPVSKMWGDLFTD